MEAAPTNRKAVICVRCLGLDWGPCPYCGHTMALGVCGRCDEEEQASHG